MDGKLAIDPDEFFALTGIPKSTQAKGRLHGDFCPHLKRGRRVYYLKSDVEAWLLSLRRTSTSDSGDARNA
jgi:hypothetical protein